MVVGDLDAKIAMATEMILASRRLVVFTGAGISTESGIPDFRDRGESGQNLIPRTSPYKNSSGAKKLEENNGKY